MGITATTTCRICKNTHLEAVLDLGKRAGFASVGLREDLAGTPRAALLRWER